MKERTLYFYDCEFWERGNSFPIKPISIGIVCEDGRELYSELDFDWCRCDNVWLHENVKPSLRTLHGNVSGVGNDSIKTAKAIKEFVGKDQPRFVGYMSAYDHVVLCQLFGRMVDLPKGWPFWTFDIKQWAVELGDPRLPKQDVTRHHALADALWTKATYEWLVRYEEAVTE